MSFKLETERLILRHVDPERDFEAWADCFADKETMTFIGGGPGMSRCLLYTSPSPRDATLSRMPSSA